MSYKIVTHKINLDERFGDSSKVYTAHIQIKEGKTKKIYTCTAVILLASKGGASDAVRARNTGINEEKGILT